MLKLTWGTIGLTALVCLAGCDSEYEAPSKQKVQAAMAEWSNDTTVASLDNLECNNLGRGKFYCSFDIAYIGAPPEKMEKCFFSSASEVTIQPNSKCY